ncbi:MAG: hypothetical protein QNJ34_19235 [Xenococcaceae cyanobacterium MO_188.B29]|nr:hypothetical protein [Xenococcaceae cyanobacterium MO_188.B29]
MGDINFNIAKNVDLNKVVNLDIDKDVDVNVNNDDILATAEADAEAFGERALAETDAYTYVRGEGSSGTIFTADGSIDVLGNTTDLELGTPNITGLPSTVTVDYTSSGSVVAGLPDLDDFNAFDSLANLNNPLPTNDNPIPIEDVFVADNDKILVFDSLISDSPLEGRYVLQDNWIVDFGPEELDMDGDGFTGVGNLTLTIPAGATYLVEQLANGEIEVEFEAFAPDANGFFTYDDTAGPVSKSVFELTGYVQEAESLEIGNLSDWAFQAAYESIEEVNGTGSGEAFSYAESTAALDLNGDDNVVPIPPETEL